MADQNHQPASQEPDNSRLGYGGYGHRPLWQWIVLYVVIGGIIYWAIYYFFFAGKNGMSGLYGSRPTSSSPAVTTSTSTSSVAGSILMTRTDPSKGQYLADSNGLTLYTYGGDSAGVSNCSGSCVAAWPIYTAGSNANLPAHVSVITRSDGARQYTYRGFPLYHFSGDTAAGQITGDGVSDFHLAKP